MSNTDLKLLKIATVLDPRIYKIKFSDIGNIFEDRKFNENYARNYYQAYYSKSSETVIRLNREIPQSVPTVNSFFSMIEEFCEESISEPPNLNQLGTESKDINEEMDRFLRAGFQLSETVFHTSMSIFDFWKAISPKYSNVSLLARDLLAAAPSSVPAERLFSAAGRHLDPLRSKTKSKNLRNTVCLKNWLEKGNIFEKRK